MSGRNLELAMRITADLDAAQKDTEQLHENFEQVEQSAKDSGKAFDALTKAAERTSRAMSETQAKSSATTKELAANAAASKAAATGLKETTTAADKATKSNERLAPAVKTSTDAMGKLGRTAGQQTQAMRQLPMQITDIVTGLASGQSVFMVAIQQGGQLRDSFGGITPALGALASVITPTVVAVTAGVAAIAGIGVALYQSYDELRDYERALISTGGAAGTSAGEVADLADDVGDATGRFSDAEDAAQLLASSGKVAAGALEDAISGAVNLSELTGDAIEETTDKIIRLSEAPSAMLLKLNEQYHFLTLEVYEHVRSLEEQGKAEEAARVAIEAFARVHESRVTEAREQAGSLERAWVAVNEAIARAWQNVRNIGRDDAPFRMAEAAKEMAMYSQERRRLLDSGEALTSDPVKFVTLRYQDAAEEYKKAAQQLGREQGKAQADATRQKGQDAAIAAQVAIGKALEDGKSKTDRLRDATAKLNEQFLALKRNAPNAKELAGVTFGADGAISGGAYDKALRGLQDKFKETTRKGRKPAQTDGQKDEAAAQRELENLRTQIQLVGTLADTDKKATEAARVRAQISDGAYKNASQATKQELLDQAQLLDTANLRHEADQKLLQVRLQIAGLQGSNDAELAKTTAELTKLKGQLDGMGRSADAADVSKLLNLSKATADIKDLQQTYNRVMGEISLETQRIAAEQEAGLKTESEAQQAIIDLYRDRIDTLRQLVPLMRASALALGDTEAGRAALANVEQIELKIRELTNTTNLLQQAVRETFQGSFKQLLLDLADTASSVGDDLRTFIGNIASGLAEHAAEQLSQKVTNLLMSKFGSLLGMDTTAPEDKAALAMTTAGDTAAAAIVQAGTAVASAISAAAGAGGALAGAPAGGVPLVDPAAVQDAAGDLAKSGANVNSGALALGNSALQLAGAAGALSPGASAIIQAALQLLNAAITMRAANAAGGAAGGFATGGLIRGAGTGTSDSIRINASNHEFMTRAKVVRQPGALPFLYDFNRRGMAALDAWRTGYATGGLIGAQPVSGAPSPAYRMADAGAMRAAAVTNRLAVMNFLDIDKLADALAQNGRFQKSVVNTVIGESGPIQAGWNE